MSDKKIPQSLLKRKSTRSRKSKTDRAINMKSLKHRLLLEVEQTKKLEREMEREQCIKMNKTASKYNLPCYLSLYEELSKDYLSETFNNRILSLITRMVKSTTQEIQCNFPVHKILLKVCKTFLLNEMEISLYSILLERFGWYNSNFNFDENLHAIAMLAKSSISSQHIEILSALKKSKPNLEEIFKRFVSEKLEGNRNLLHVNNRELNDRFQLLCKPFHVASRENYTDYNFLVDQILSTSLPYSETKKNDKSAMLDTLSQYNRVNLLESGKPIFNVVSNNPFNDYVRSTRTNGSSNMHMNGHERSENERLASLYNNYKDNEKEDNIQFPIPQTISGSLSQQIPHNISNVARNQSLAKKETIFENYIPKSISRMDSNYSIMNINFNKEPSMINFKEDMAAINLFSTFSSNMINIENNSHIFGGLRDEEEKLAKNGENHDQNITGKAGLQIFAPNLLSKKKEEN